MTMQEYYAQHGAIIIASRDFLYSGPLDRNDWHEDDMAEFRWAVVADSSKQDLIDQNTALGFSNKIDPFFRFFYKVVALD